MSGKYRHELKYICSETELKQIECKMRYILKPDRNTGIDGKYLIRSVYFDDYNRSAFYANEDGTDPREKFRIRIYNCSEEYIQLEKKVKYKNMTQKQSCRLDSDTCQKMLRGEDISEHFGKDSLLDQWIYANKTALLKPVMLGEYVRMPYVYNVGNVRITIDRNIQASRNIEKLFERDISKVAVLPTGYHVLEVKYDDILPSFIYKKIDCGRLRQCIFSKFYLGCKALEGRLENVV